MPKKKIDESMLLSKEETQEEFPQEEIRDETPEIAKIEAEEAYVSNNKLFNLLGSNLVRNNKQLGVVARFSKIGLNTFLVIFGGSLVAITVLVYCFLQYPRPTANFFAYKSGEPPEATAAVSGPAVLAATTTAPNLGQTVASTVLYPHAVVALAIVRQVDPQLYTEVAPTVIPPSVTDVFHVGTQNQLTPNGQLVIQKNGAGMNLKVLNQDLVNNLNADLVQGRRPGSAAGDLAIFGLGGAIDGLAISSGNITTGAVTSDAIAPQAVTTIGIANKTILSANIADGTITGSNVANNTITSSNIADATITDSDIATGAAIGNSKLTQLTSSNLVAGSAVELSATGGLTNSAGLSLLRTCSASQTLIWDGSSWVCGLSGSGGTLTLEEDAVPIVTSATTLNVVGSDFTLTNPSANTGLLAIDYANSGITRKAQNDTVSGTWTFSNGLTISGGTVSLPAGSISNAALANSSLTITPGTGLSGGGIISLGGSATLNLANTTVAVGSYGSSGSTVPTFTVDAQGRLSSASSYTISGLTTSNFGSGNISQWTNNSGYITAGSSDILSNKTIAAGSNTISGLTNTNFASTNISQWLNDVGFITATGSAVLSNKIIAASSNTISGLIVTNFGSSNVSQWTNDAGYLTATGSAILTNKTIDASSNTISGLTNANLSGSAGITNANLANSAFSFQGNSGSGAVSLGSTLFVTGTGLTTVTATSSGLTINSTGGSLQNAYDTGNTITTSTGRNIAFTLPAGLVTPTSFTLTNNGTADSFVISDAANSNIDGTTRRSIFITPGSIIQNTAGSTGTYSGIDVTLPALTLTSGNALTVNGMRITTDGLTQTAGLLTNNGLLVDSTGSTITTGGTINGIKISGPTTIPSVGTYNNLFLGTSTSSTANTLDQATIAVGSISATAQNNFASLNLTNGGSGYLDIEVMRGFINFRGMNTLYDDFTNKILDTTSEWTMTVTGGGSSCAQLAGGVGGLLHLETDTAASRGCELTTQAIATLTNGYYQAQNNPTFETRLSINNLTNFRAAVGFTGLRIPVAADTAASNNHAYILKRAADTQWQCATDDGGATETITSTGVTIVANTFYRLRVEVRRGTTSETVCTIDDGTTVTRTVVTATQPGATSPMDVYVRDNQSDAVIKWMDVDYVRAWQDDPVLAVDNAGASVLSASITPTPTPDVSSSSASLTTVIADGVNNIFHNLVEFFNTVIFHADVTFLGHVAFNGDSAGVATIKAGESGTSVIFASLYQNSPIVTASVNLVGGMTPDQVPQFAVYDITGKGFVIKLSRPVASDLAFSWIAFAANGASSLSSVQSTPTPLPTPTVSPTLGQTPVSSESPIVNASQSGTVSP